MPLLKEISGIHGPCIVHIVCIFLKSASAGHESNLTM